MKNNVYFINNVLDGDTHDIIDSSLVTILTQEYDAVKIHVSPYRAKFIHKNNERFLDAAQLKKITYKNSKPLKSKFFISKIGKLIKDLLIAFKDSFILLKGERGAVYFFSYGNSSLSLHFVNLISKLTNKKIVICCHNELEILNKNSYSFWNYRFYMINRFYRKTKWAKHLRLLVLGDFIINNITTILPNHKIKHFTSIDHPYFIVNDTASQISLKNNLNEKNIIKIGVVSMISERKGMSNLLQFIAALKNIHNVKLYIISRITNMEKLTNNNVIFLNSNNVHLDRETYDAFLEQMDYFYFPYPMENFHFSVSGAVYECFIKEKPIIAYRNSHFNYIAKKHGDFGFLFNSFEEIKQILIKISKNEIEKIKLDKEKILEELSPINYKLDFNYE